MSQPVKIIAIMQAAEGKVEDLQQALEKFVIETRKERGCEFFVLNRSTDDEHTLIVTETWSDEEALQEHLNGAAAQRLRESGATGLVVGHQLHHLKVVV